MSSQQLQKILLERLEMLASAGITHLPAAKSPISFEGENESSTDAHVVAETASAPSRTPLAQNKSIQSQKPAAAAPARPISFASQSDEVDTRPYPEQLDTNARVEQLGLLSREVASCVRCKILSSCRKQTVFGVGNPSPRLVFFGEAPGADEDRQGEPFVGAAGQLLNRIIAACKMSREDVYILNTVKCRPPENRNPTAEEMDNCWEYAEKQLEILRPEFICCLGRVAAQKLLKTDSHIGPLRGKFFRYRDSQVIVTYHPAYLLRTESAKKLTWDDMKMLMSAMGVTV